MGFGSQEGGYRQTLVNVVNGEGCDESRVTLVSRAVGMQKLARWSSVAFHTTIFWLEYNRKVARVWEWLVKALCRIKVVIFWGRGKGYKQW